MESTNTITRPPLIIAKVNTVRLHTNSHRAGISRNQCRKGLMRVRFYTAISKSNKNREFSNNSEFLGAEKILKRCRDKFRLHDDNPVRPLQEILSEL